MLDRHNGVCREIYYQLCRLYGLTTVHFTQVIPPVSENDLVKIHYDRNMVVRSVCRHNRPDLVEKIESLGISEYRKVLEKFQRAAVQGTGRLVRAHL
eukprot:gene26932-32425_t